MVVISIIVTCSCACQTASHVDQRYPMYQFDNNTSGQILSAKEWAARYHPYLASRRALSRLEYETLNQEYDRYVRITLANRDFEIRQREAEANIRLIKAQTKLLEAETGNNTAEVHPANNFTEKSIPNNSQKTETKEITGRDVVNQMMKWGENHTDEKMKDTLRKTISQMSELRYHQYTKFKVIADICNQYHDKYACNTTGMSFMRSIPDHPTKSLQEACWMNNSEKNDVLKQIVNMYINNQVSKDDALYAAEQACFQRDDPEKPYCEACLECLDCWAVTIEEMMN